MSLSLYRDPFDYMMRQLHQVFGDQDWQSLVAAQHSARLGPRMDLIETDKGYEVNFEIPGIKKEEIKVDLHNNVLCVSGECKRQEEHKKNNYRISERSYGQFSRNITLPHDIDESKIHASYENGLLHVCVPKTEVSCARKVTVN